MWVFNSFSIKDKDFRELFNGSSSAINAFDIFRRAWYSDLEIITESI
jgi:hypothetical protein